MKTFFVIWPFILVLWSALAFQLGYQVVKNGIICKKPHSESINVEIQGTTYSLPCNGSNFNFWGKDRVIDGMMIVEPEKLIEESWK